MGSDVRQDLIDWFEDAFGVKPSVFLGGNATITANIRKDTVARLAEIIDLVPDSSGSVPYVEPVQKDVPDELGVAEGTRVGAATEGYSSLESAVQNAERNGYSREQMTMAADGSPVTDHLPKA